MNEVQTIAEVESIAAKYGIELTRKDYQDVQEVMDERRMHLESEYAAAQRSQSGAAAFWDKLNRVAPRLFEAMRHVGDLMITAVQTFLIAFGIPLALVMLLVVEQQRVYHGVELFESHSALAAFSAWALVILNLILELLISWVEHHAGYSEPVRFEFSLRLLARRVEYIFGFGRGEWAARGKSPAFRFRAVLRMVSISIVVLALTGSMRSVIERTDGNWAAALLGIVTDSTLLEMLVWASGLLFTLTAVVGAQTLSQYVARKVIEVMALLNSNVDDKPRRIAEAVGATGAAFLLARVKQYQAAIRRGAQVAPTGGGGDVPNRIEQPAALTNPPSVPSVPNRTEQVGPKVARVMAWLDQNPNHGLSVREVAELLSVSATTVHTAMKMKKGSFDGYRS